MAAALLVLGAGGWGVVAVAAGAVLRGQPDRALFFAPWDARARSAAAEQVLRRGELTLPALNRAGALARAALARDMLVVPAWRTAGLAAAAANRDKLAGDLFGTAEKLSRRDLPTELWLIEQRVQSKDVAGALAHYDIALRTNPDSYDALLPILVSAAGDPATAPALGRLLATRPVWANNFFYRLSQDPPEQPFALARTLEIARQGGILSNTESLRLLVPKLIERGAYQAAMRVAATLGGNAARMPKFVHNGGFEQEPRVPPLDWDLVSNDSYGAELRSGVGHDAQALVATATSDANGEAARQFLVLPPGSYRLGYSAGRTSAAPPDRLSWHVTCNKGAVVLDQPIDLNRSSGSAEARFTVPSGCAAQWLGLEVASSSPDGSEAWVDDVSVTPAH